MRVKHEQSAQYVDYEPAGKYSLICLLLWLVIAMFLPLVGGALTLRQVVLGAIHLTGSWAFGALLLGRLKVVTEMGGIARDGVALLVGSFLLYPILALPSADVKIAGVLSGVSVVAVITATYLRRINLTLPPVSEVLAVMAALLFSIIVSVGNGDLLRALTRLPILLVNEEITASYDTEYFTSIVATMRHGTIASAVYEMGSPLAYHVLSFFPPSVFAVATESTSHVALWGVWMPLYNVLGLLLSAEVANRFIGRREWQPVWRDASVVTLMMLLSPLHPLYILKAVPTNFVWLGIGWLTGGGNPPATAGIVWAALAVAAAFPGRADGKPDRGDLVFLIAILATLLAVKVPMFFAVGAFLTSVGLIRAFRGERALLVSVIIAAPLAVAIYMWALRGSATAISFHFDYLPTYFAKLAGFNPDGWHTLVVGSVVGVSMFVVWGSIRCLGMAALFFTEESKGILRRRREAVIAAVAALFGCGVFASLTSLTARDRDIDWSFDLQQFPRMAFLLVTILGVAGVVNFLSSRKIPPAYRRLSICVIWLWCFLAATPLVLNNLRHPRPSAEPNRWLADVRNELKEHKPDAMVIDPSKTYPGLLLTASDVGPFWVSQHGMREGVETHMRTDTFSDALSAQPERQASACAVLKSQGVDTIIATLDTERQVEHFAQKCNYRRASGQRWVWRRVAKP